MRTYDAHVRELDAILWRAMAASPGDTVIIITYANVDSDDASSLHPTVVQVDARNRQLVPVGA